MECLLWCFFYCLTCTQRADAENDDEALTEHVYPEPHRAPRSRSMETACWEIKWEHRDDCVSALMVNIVLSLGVVFLLTLIFGQTLRRVPHLTVTWAHQPVPSGQTNRSTNYQNHSPYSYQISYQNTSHSSQSPNASFIRSQPLRELSQNVNVYRKSTLVNAPNGRDTSLRLSLKEPSWSEDCESPSFIKGCESEGVNNTKHANQEDNIWTDKGCLISDIPCTRGNDKQALCDDAASEGHSGYVLLLFFNAAQELTATGYPQ